MPTKTIDAQFLPPRRETNMKTEIHQLLRAQQISVGGQKGTEKGELNAVQSKGGDLCQQVSNFNVSFKRNAQLLGC